MDFKSKLIALQNSVVTIFVVGRSDDFTGTLIEIGDDFVTVSPGPNTGPHHAQSVIPINAISCIGTVS